MTTPHKYPRVMKGSWNKFIKASTEHPKLGHWSDMSLAPVGTFVLLFCEAHRPYSYYHGQALGICLEGFSKVTDKMEYEWYMVGQWDKEGIFNYTKCNPMWWMPLPMSPPERPGSAG